MKVTNPTRATAVFWLGVFVSAVVLTPGTIAQDKDKTLAVDPEEYAVYSALLDSVYSTPKVKQFVINSETTTKTKQPFIGINGGLMRTGAARPETEPDTKSNFDEKSEKTVLLEKRFNLKVPYILTSDEELKKLFAFDANGHINPKVWDDFYKQYPGAEGVVALSRVGFDVKKNQALVYVAVKYGWLGGSGRFYVLTRNSGEWVVEKQVLIWMS
jgi:hypothetical protein